MAGSMNHTLLWTMVVQCLCWEAELFATADACLRIEIHLTDVLHGTENVLLSK